MSEKQLNLYKKIPISHRNDFWISLMKAIEKEILTMSQEMEKKKTLLSYRDSSLENLLDLLAAFIIFPRENFETIREMLNKSYGIPDSIIEFYMRQELYKVPFNHKEKGTLQFYHTIFSTFGFSFDHQITIYRYIPGTTNTIIRDIKPLLDSVSETNFEYGFIDDEETILTDDYFSLGYIGIRPILHSQQSKNNFSGYTADPQVFDYGEFVPDPSGEYRFSEELGTFVFDSENGDHSWSGMKMDEDVVFNTVTKSVITSTKHIGLEIEINDLVMKNYQPYLLPYEALQYIFASAYFYKRQVEVPHVGAQLTIVFERSGFWDTHSDEIITQNVIPLPNFEQDYIWKKGADWKIAEGKASFEGAPVVPPPQDPSDLSLLQNAFVLPGMDLQDLEEGNFGEIPKGTQIRFSLTVDATSPYPLDPTVPILFVFTVDSSNNFKRVLFEIRDPGHYEEDFIWQEDEQSIINIASLTPVTLSRIEAIPFERFSIPEIRSRGAMRQGVTEEGIIDIDYIQFGMGSQAIPSRLDDDYNFPTELESPLAVVFPIGDTPGANSERYEAPGFIGAIAQYTGQLVNGAVLGVFEPSGSMNFNGQLPPEILPYRRGTLVLSIVDVTKPFETPLLIKDDGLGKLISSIAGVTGTINYTTGAFYLEFEEPYFLPRGVLLQQVYIESPTYVTEVGVWGRTTEDPIEPQLLAYTTFAPVELMSNAFHLNMGVILER